MAREQFLRHIVKFSDLEKEKFTFKTVMDHCVSQKTIEIGARIFTNPNMEIGLGT